MSSIITLKDDPSDPDIVLPTGLQSQLTAYTRNTAALDPSVMEPLYLTYNRFTQDDQDDDDLLPADDHGTFAKFDLRRNGLQITAVPIWKDQQPGSEWSILPSGLSKASEYYAVDETDFFSRQTYGSGASHQAKLATDVCLINFQPEQMFPMTSDFIHSQYTSGKLHGAWIENLLPGEGGTVIDRLTLTAVDNSLR